MATEVAIFGGGIGGLSAAHWLTHLPADPSKLSITVYEKSGDPGGKARSFRLGPGGPPAEHGFRFFPGYYWWITGIMAGIPYPISSSATSVYDNLVPAKKTQLLKVGQTPIPMENSWRGLKEFKRGDLKALRALEIDNRELQLFARKLSSLYWARPEKLHRLDHTSWWNFVKADGKSAPYQDYIADGLNVRTVAARGRDLSATTVGTTLLRLVSDWLTEEQGTDRVLNGPTSEQWIVPWTEHLASKGVDIRYDTSLEELEVDPSSNTISGAYVRSPGNTRQRITKDYYVVAVPVEVMQRLVTDELRMADPTLAKLFKLKTAWMTGIQFFLGNPVPSVPGHRIYVDSPWALTSISQKQFWEDSINLGSVNNTSVLDILSVIISDWSQKCEEHNRPLAEHTDLDQIKKHVWGDIKNHLSAAADQRLRDGDLLGASLDPAIRVDLGRRLWNDEPLLINRPGDWHYRPSAETAVKNLCLAADYVRTDTDLATMESAAEAAKDAALKIICNERLGRSAEARRLLERPAPPRLQNLKRLVWGPPAGLYLSMER